jgi:uncharacterized protein
MHFAIAPKASMENEPPDPGISIEVCYIGPLRQFYRTVQIERGGTIREAILASRLLEECAGLELEALKVGVFSRLKTLDWVLRQNDRVEVYRPLLVDPMSARRARVQKKSKKNA